MAEGEINIELVWIASHGVQRRSLRMHRKARVLDALRASDVLLHIGLKQGAESELQASTASRLTAQAWVLAVHGQRVGLDEALHDHDRIELLPPLMVDPKIARQRRAEHRRRQQGERRWSPDRAVVKSGESQSAECEQG